MMQLKKTTRLYGIDLSWWLFGCILIVNISQSIVTPLLNDESYYWLYAQFPSWGYFDHPPMIAFLIKIGTSIFSNEIGVRLLEAIIGSLTFYLVYKIIESETEKPVEFKLAALLLCSSLFLNLYSFLAIPDTPMLFFATLFVYTYRRYLHAETLLNTMLLGVVAALLLYSKYHGILLIGFTVLSNSKLIFKKSFYIVFFIVLLLYAPHIYWQVQHDYPTIRFQFFERAGAFNIQHVLSYIGEQAGVTGPIILLLFSILYKPKNQFQKSLKYNVVGIFVFFLFSSFKEMVNVHWTAIAWPSMLCLSYLYIAGLIKNRKLVFGALIFNLIIVIIFRADMIFNIFTISNFNDKNPRVMTLLLKANAKGYPLVFNDMYNEPSLFWFYSRQESFAVNDIDFKKTQYNYLNGLEKNFQGKTVSFISLGPVNDSSKEIAIPRGKRYFITTIHNFTSFSTTIKIEAPGFTHFKSSAESTIHVTIENTLTNEENNMLEHEKPYLLLTFINSKTKQTIDLKYPEQLDISNKEPFGFAFKAPTEAGKYNYIFSVVAGKGFIRGFNSDIYSCTIDNR